MANIEGGSNTWTWQQDKDFETCLVIYPENSENRWENIASKVNKTPQEVQQHYQILLDDIASIEGGNVDLPNYSEPSFTRNVEYSTEETGWSRRKGQVWTEEEHEQFLLGLEKYGKGDWKSIAREFVITRSSTQVASHAQKHFKRQDIEANSKKTRKKRSSIFDITSPSNGDKGVVTVAEGVCFNNGVHEQVMPTLVVNETVSVPQSPPLWSPPSNWCVDSEGVLDLGLLEFGCLSELPPF